MKLKNLKFVLCIFKGHKLTTPSIIDFMDKGNYLCKCYRCGLYEAHGEVGTITVSEKWAIKTKKEFDELFKLFEVKNNE